MTPGGVENVTIELADLKSPYFDPGNLFLAILEVKRELKWTKFSILTLQYDLLTLKMIPGGVENVTIKLDVLKTPQFDLENVFLAHLEVILVQTQVNLSDSS